MKIICIQNTAKDLDLTIVNNIFTNNYKYTLTIGETYLVMGIAIYKRSHCPYYLIDNNGWPRWFPYMLFDVLDNKIPISWYTYISQLNSPGDISFLIGFDELCNDEDYYDNLMDREEQAMLTFYRRTEEMEQELNRKIF